jgi:MoaA/NifB/PqqE/SkfB family radical SAM enzyme
MSKGTFENAIAQIRQMPVQTLRIIGAGEATLHPNFVELVQVAKGAAPVVSLTTNGQVLSAEVCAAIAETLDLVEVSVDADNAGEYERLRKGANLQRLLDNLKRLRVAALGGRRPIVRIRVMFRPTDCERQRDILAYWKQHGDVVSTQRLQDYFGARDDLFRPAVDPRHFRRCASIFKFAGINWNGDVPLCDASALQSGDATGLVLGNVNTTPLAAIWHGDVISRYREAHRRCDDAGAPLCRACPCSWS